MMLGGMRKEKDSGKGCEPKVGINILDKFN